MYLNDSVVSQVSAQRTIFETELATTRTGWDDVVADRYFHKHINPIVEAMALYLNGGSGIRGMGVAELIDYLNRKAAEMDKII